ncbi:MAG: GNAT family N-acetyltransferase [Gammaproteobacteria bacterium]|nr:GNAT family N-acetyltransferase [Gammaproteobacteria bacterium]
MKPERAQNYKKEANNAPALTITEPFSYDQFQQYYDLRWRILRAPWKQPRGTEKDQREDDSYHVMVIDTDQTVIGVGRLHLNSPEQAQIRFMAVETQLQRQGIGKMLLFALEKKAREWGASEIIFDARANIAGFYKRYGYVTLGQGHTLFGSVHHYKMSKRIRI